MKNKLWFIIDVLVIYLLHLHHILRFAHFGKRNFQGGPVNSYLFTLILADFDAESGRKLSIGHTCDVFQFLSICLTDIDS